MAASVVDTHQYAEQLRKSLMADLFEGDELTTDGDQEHESYDVFNITGGAMSMKDLDQQIEEFQSNYVVRGILDHGRVLKEYAIDIDEKLRQVELDSIQDYIQESDNLVALHEQVKDCDNILSHMEQMLGKFQGDLGKVSEEIRQLQVQSQTMSMKLKNRRAAENKLGSFVEQIAIPEDLVMSILESEVSEDYLEYLLALDRKLKFVSTDDIARTSQAKKDAEPALEKLRIKAVTKVREFLLQKVYTLRRPKTNIQIIQQNVLLKYKYFIRFLQQHGQDVYQEIRSEYIGVLSKILSHHFRSYLASMEKMQMVIAGPGDVLGAATTTPSVNVLALFGKQAAKQGQSEAAFELNDRASILHQLEQPAIIPHMADYEGKRFPFEVLFRNVHKLLMDTATSEFFFCLDFFEEEAVFKELFAPVISVVESDLINVVQELHDMIALMLMIRVNHEHRRIMIKRRVPCLDDYLDRVHLLLWPRLKVNFDAQLNSIKSGNERTLFSNSVGVHFVVRRYAALTSSMLLLMAEQEQEAQGIFKAQGLHDMMERMWGAIFDMLLRMSNMFKDRRQGIIFLIINYNHIMMVLRTADQSASQGSPTASPSASSGGLGKSGATAIKECEDQLANCTSLYVEDQLHQHYRELVEYVKKAEQTQKRLAVPDGAQIPGYGPAQASSILRDFAGRWMQSIEAINKEVIRQFTDGLCGRDVLQASMTQLLLYYTRMLELVKKQGPEGMALVREAITIPCIMYEIKRITK